MNIKQIHNNSLNITQTGQGPDLVCLHGWCMNSKVWNTALKNFEQTHRIHWVDLPGHGENAKSLVGPEINDWAEQIAKQVPENATWMGWSLGGLITLQASQHIPIAQLIMVASSPKFIQADDWSAAMRPEVLNQFADELENDYQTTLNQFLSLQAMGASQVRQTVRQLRGSLKNTNAPSVDALRTGLKFLHDVDLRSTLQSLSQPVLYILGANDALVPRSVAPALKQLNPHVKVDVIKGSGHAPFISHTEQFLETVNTFIQ